MTQFSQVEELAEMGVDYAGFIFYEKSPRFIANKISPDILKKYGDELIVENKFLALKVPSAILFEENNFILNTTNKDFHKIKVIYSRVLAIDERLLNFGR